MKIDISTWGTSNFLGAAITTALANPAPTCNDVQAMIAMLDAIICLPGPPVTDLAKRRLIRKNHTMWRRIRARVKGLMTDERAFRRAFKAATGIFMKHTAAHIEELAAAMTRGGIGTTAANRAAIKAYVAGKVPKRLAGLR